MGKGSGHIQGGLLILMAFVLVGSFMIFLSRTAIPQAADRCKDKDCSPNPPLGRVQFKRESLVAFGEKKSKSVTQTTESHWPTDEEWLLLIEELGDNHANNTHIPKYAQRHGLIVHQIQNGSYDYSYGNDGKYQSKMLGKVHRHQNRGHTSSIYFQMAEGQTGTPPLQYQSGFAIFSRVHFLINRGSAHWKGTERGVFFNKNPDGSYLVFASAQADLKGRSKAITRTTVQITESASSVMHATQFTAKSQTHSITNFTSNGKVNDMTSTMKMFVKATTRSPSPAEVTGKLEGFTGDKSATGKLKGLTSDKSMTIKGNASGVYPKYGPGDYLVNFNATIAGSILNSTLVTNTRGHTWFNHRALSPVHSSSLHHLNFLI